MLGPPPVRRRRTAILAAMLLASGMSARATTYPREDPVVLQGPLDDRVQLQEGWRYHPGDNPAWAAPEVDDHGWPVVMSLLASGEDPPGGWPGIGWFRRRLVLGEGMPATAVAIRPMQGGASEIFLDGRLVMRVGVVSADPSAERPVYPNDFAGIALEPGRQHVLAVRYSNARGNLLGGPWRGFALNVRSVESAASAYHRWGYLVLTSSAAFGGAFGALAVLHVLLFAFYPASREHLFFAAFSATIATSLALRISIELTTDLIARLSLLRPYMALSILSVVLGLVLVHVLVRRRPAWPTWVVGAAGIALAAWVWSWNAFRDETAVGVFFLLGYLEMLRVSISAVRRRQPDVWIVAVAFIPLAGIAVLRISAGLLRHPLDVGPLSNAALVVVGLAFSLFISRRAARTSRELERRVVEVRELSAQTVEQERRAARQEAERKVLEAEHLRRTHELETARRLQVAMLPPTLPRIDGVELAFRMVTATEVGGDYVDLRSTDGGTPLLAVGDATSHGLHAGMVVAVAKSLFQGVDPVAGPLAALERIGNGLQAMHERHASMAMVIMQLSRHQVRVASAGMPPVLIFRCGSGEVEEVLVPGVPLGTLADATYRLQEIPVVAGDAVLVATDGLAEAMDADGEAFGYARMAEQLRRLGSRPPLEIVDGMLAAVTSFLDGSPPEDDITLVAMAVS